MNSFTGSVRTHVTSLYIVIYLIEKRTGDLDWATMIPISIIAEPTPCLEFSRYRLFISYANTLL